MKKDAIVTLQKSCKELVTTTELFTAIKSKRKVVLANW